LIAQRKGYRGLDSSTECAQRNFTSEQGNHSRNYTFISMRLPSDFYGLSITCGAIHRLFSMQPMLYTHQECHTVSTSPRVQIFEQSTKQCNRNGVEIPRLFISGSNDAEQYTDRVVKIWHSTAVIFQFGN
jgi:hypothetical protein